MAPFSQDLGLSTARPGAKNYRPQPNAAHHLFLQNSWAKNFKWLKQFKRITLWCEKSHGMQWAQRFWDAAMLGCPSLAVPCNSRGQRPGQTAETAPQLSARRASNIHRLALYKTVSPPPTRGKLVFTAFWNVPTLSGPAQLFLSCNLSPKESIPDHKDNNTSLQEVLFSLGRVQYWTMLGG